MEPASTARARSAGLGTGRVRLVFLGSHDSSLCPDLLFLWHVFLCLCCQCRAGRNAVRNRSRRDLDNGLQHVGAAQLHHQVRLHGLNHRCAELPAGQYATRDRAQPGERYNLLARDDRDLQLKLHGLHLAQHGPEQRLHGQGGRLIQLPAVPHPDPDHPDDCIAVNVGEDHRAIGDLKTRAQVPSRPQTQIRVPQSLP